MKALLAALVVAEAAAIGGGDLRSTSGARFSLTELLARGPVVLVFWNSWLPGAADFGKLLPEVEAASERSGWLGAVVVFQEESAEAAHKLLGGAGKLPRVLDRRGELLRQFKVTRAPAVLLVEPNGEVRARSGPDPADVRELLRRMTTR